MITQQRLKELVEYNPNTGLFTRIKRGIGIKQGIIINTPNVTTGYLDMQLDARHYSQHRIAWFYIHNEWPIEIDHINGIRTDNRLINLRNVDRFTNAKNHKIRECSKSGIVGVHFCNRYGKWIAQINVNKKHHYIGSFVFKQDAINARKQAEIKYNFHPNHGRR